MGRMPPDHLGQPTPVRHNPVDDEPTVTTTERAVLAALTGTPVAAAAHAERLDATDLAEAIEIYQRAGREALRQQDNPGWWQIYLQFTHLTTAEHAFTDHVVPLLQRAEDDGVIDAWWFMRKHPCWRVRLRPGATGHTMTARLSATLDQLVSDGHIGRWWHGIYEAETSAFGGAAGMAVAHDLLCADSRAVVNLFRRNETGVGRHELSLLLCSSLLRAARVEWYEQGEVWHQVALERRLPPDVPTWKLTAMAGDLAHLLRADTSADGPLLAADGPLASAAEWAAAFRYAGRALGTADRAGTLQRGLRAILSHLVIFHWNRLGLSSRTQSILAWAARTTILGQSADQSSSPSADRVTPRSPRRRHPTAADEESAGRAVTQFPLIVQGRRYCADLETRMQEVRAFADSCHTPAKPHDRIDRACSAWNLAALLVADCGVPDLAAELCHQQFQILQAAWPVSAPTAIASLQPLVNLARLTKHGGNPETAYHDLATIHRAAHHGDTALIHGKSVSFDGFTASENDRSTVDLWLRRLMREDGTRALTAAGHWNQAAAHAEQYDDSTEILREARQTRIIAHVLDGHTNTARALLDASLVRQPWERAVAACLRTYTQLNAEESATDDITRMLAAVHDARQTFHRASTLFRVQLGLTAIDLAAGLHPDETNLLCTELIDEAQRSTDAYAAREVLSHPPCRTRMTSAQSSALTALVDRARLESGTLPESVLDHLMASVRTAGNVLAHSLGIASEAALPPTYSG